MSSLTDMSAIQESIIILLICDSSYLSRLCGLIYVILDCLQQINLIFHANVLNHGLLKCQRGWGLGGPH